MGWSMHAVSDAYDRIDKIGDPWLKIDRLVNFEAFRESLEECWRPEDAKPEKGGRPPWDAVLMFKVLLIGRKTGMSDQRLEEALAQNLALIRFIGKDIGDAVPDRTTIARYRDRLDDDTVREVFDLFHDQLEAAGFKAKDGQMLDSTPILTPIQRNTRAENETIKEGETPEKWQEDEATAKLRQKDVDARWTKKGSKNIFGYKNHACVDVKHKLIQGYVTTPASDGDITVMEELTDPRQRNEPLYADSAYRSKDAEKLLRKRKIKPRMQFKRQKGKELTSYQKTENKQRSKVRARVEHVFGSMANELGGKFIRTIGIERAKVQVGMLNLLYNMHRMTFLVKAADC